MSEFSNKVLVENTKAYLQIQSQMKRSGYNPFLFKQLVKAKEKVEAQIKLYEASLTQKIMKI